MYCTTDPGVVVLVPADTVVVRPGTSTVTVLAHRASVLPLAQLLPAVAEVIVLARLLFPVSGLFTVTENVMVADAPAARFPVQVRLGWRRLSEPAVAAGVAVVGGVVQHPGQRIGQRRARCRRPCRSW